MSRIGIPETNQISCRRVAERCRRVTLGFALGKLTLQIGYELLGIG